jgi:hypothetical protein
LTVAASHQKKINQTRPDSLSLKNRVNRYRKQAGSAGVKRLASWKGEISQLARVVRPSILWDPAVNGVMALVCIRTGLEQREQTLLRFVEDMMYNHRQSPYLPCFDLPNVSWANLREMVSQRGVNEALRAFAEAGVRAPIDELKVRSPAVRGNTKLDPRECDFDNPRLTVP